MTTLVLDTTSTSTSTSTGAATRTAARAAIDLTLDLSSAGVIPHPHLDGLEPTPVKVDLAHLARLARAARSAGLDSVVLGPHFRLASGRSRAADAWLDPAVAARRLGEHAVAARVVPALAVTRAGLPAVRGLAELALSEGWAGLELSAATDAFGVQPTDGLLAEALRTVTAVWDAAAGGAARPTLVAHARTEEEVAAAGRHADVVRLTESDLAWARELRYTARGAARAAGRDAEAVRVVVDVRAVLSADPAAARERAILVDALAPQPADPGAARERALDAVGTVADAAELLHRWVSAGAADGFVLVPGSLRADVQAVVSGLLPELAALGLRAGAPASN